MSNRDMWKALATHVELAATVFLVASVSPQMTLGAVVILVLLWALVFIVMYVLID